MAFASIPEILDDLRAGKAIVLVDDESRENEGDFVVAAEAMTVEMINFLTRVGGGYLCVAMSHAPTSARTGLQRAKITSPTAIQPWPEVVWAEFQPGLIAIVIVAPASPASVPPAIV